MPAPKSSPTISFGLSLVAAAKEEKISGQPFPKANKVIPLSENVRLRRRSVNHESMREEGGSRVVGVQ